MRVVVTGATSMIGSAFVEASLESNCEILAIVRPGSKNINRLPKAEKLSVEYCDLADLEAVNGDGHPYDVLYHFAWESTSQSGRYDVKSQERNIQYTLNAVALANKLQCKKFVGAGSQAEYGYVDGVIDEFTPLNPQFPYAMAKVSAYWLSKTLCEQYGLTHIWGRIFSIYGKNDHEGTLLSYAIDCFLKGEKATFSSCEQTWNFLNEEDAGKMFFLLGEKDISKGIYFIANNQSKKLRCYMDELISAFEGKCKYEFAADTSVKVYGLDPDMRKTMQALNYYPEVEFIDGIKVMISSRRIQNK